MKKDFNFDLKNLEGMNIVENGKILTARGVAINALLTPVPGVPKSGEDHIRDWDLVKKINVDGEVDLKSEEIAQIKTQIAKNYITMVVGQMFEFLDK